MELCGGLIGTWDWDLGQRKMHSNNLGEILRSEERRVGKECW